MLQKMTNSAEMLQIVLSGNIYEEEANAIQESIIGAIDKDCQLISIDLSGIDYIDVAGLGMLVAINKQAMKNGVPLVLKGLQGRMKKLFEITRLDKLFSVR